MPAGAGGIKAVGGASEMVDAYLKSSLKSESGENLGSLLEGLPHDPLFRFVDISISQYGRQTASIDNGSPVQLRMVYDVCERTKGLRVYFDLCDESQSILLRSFNDDDADTMQVVHPGRYVSVATIPAILLAPREYELVFRATVHNVRALTPPSGLPVTLRVHATSPINRAYPHEQIRSKLQPCIPWKTEEVDKL